MADTSSSVVVKPAPEGRKPENNSQSKNQITINFPASVNANVTGQLEVKAETRQADEHKHWYNEPDAWLAILTGVLVIVTGLLAYYTRGLWTTTVSLSEDAKKTGDRQALDTQRALKISDDAAKAALKSADVSETALKAVQRAFLSMARVNHVFHLTPERRLSGVTATITFENSGVTPALKCECWSARGPFGTINFSTTTDQESTTAVIGPRTSVRTLTLAITGDELVRLWKKEFRFLIWAYVKYEDIFTVAHHTEVCMEAILLGDPDAFVVVGNDIPQILDFIAYREHNSAS